MGCHDFTVNCQSLPSFCLSFSGTREGGGLSVRAGASPPLLTAASTHHMAAACADLRGLRLVPRLTAPQGSDNVSSKPKLQSVWLGAQACTGWCLPKKAMKKPSMNSVSCRDEDRKKEATSASFSLLLQWSG